MLAVRRQPCEAVQKGNRPLPLMYQSARLGQWYVRQHGLVNGCTVPCVPIRKEDPLGLLASSSDEIVPVPGRKQGCTHGPPGGRKPSYRVGRARLAQSSAYGARLLQVRFRPTASPAEGRRAAAWHQNVGPLAKRLPRHRRAEPASLATLRLAPRNSVSKPIRLTRPVYVRNCCYRAEAVDIVYPWPKQVGPPQASSSAAAFC